MPLDPIHPTGVFTAWPTPVDSSAGTGIEEVFVQDPGDINPPIIFEPPSELSGNDTIIWIIATGGVNCGGAQVYVSLDGTTYAPIGVVSPGSAQGVLSDTFPSGSDPDNTNVLSVDLTMSRETIVAGTSADADFMIPTLAYCDGELIAFSAATLTSTYNYDLDTYIRRGCYGTAIGSHASGTQFAWIRSPFSYEYPNTLIGTTIYFKFPTFNKLGGEFQDLADCVAYPYTLTGSGSECKPCMVTETKTINYTITEEDNGKHFNNIGASGDMAYNLPAAAPDLFFGFAVDAAYYIRVNANGTDVIKIGANGTAAGGYVRSNVDSAYLVLVAHGSGKWKAMTQVGPWNIDL